MSGLVFKVQAGMDRSHRDRMAFVRICSGRFERGMVLTHAATGRPFATKYAQAVFGQQRTTVEEAFPGDIVGLVNAGRAAAGGHPLRRPSRWPSRPSRASPPSTSRWSAGPTPASFKQFRKGIEQLDGEGVIQVLTSDLRGDQAPVLAAVGPLQFEVVTDRLENEFRAPVTLEPLGYSVARRTDAGRCGRAGRAERGRGAAPARGRRAARACSAPSGGWRRCAASCPTSPSTRSRPATPCAHRPRCPVVTHVVPRSQRWQPL